MAKLRVQPNEPILRQAETPRYAFPIDPRQGEGVPDLLMRATFENGFCDLRAVNLILGCSGGTQWSHSALTKRPIDPVAIATMLGLQTERIEAILYGMRPGLINFFGARISSFNLGGDRKISPTHLKLQGYQKALWGLRCLSFDPENHEELLDRCDCGRRLQFGQTAAFFTCTKCGADLRELKPSIVDIVDSTALEFFLALIDPCADRSRQWNIGESLRNFSRGEIFTLIVESAKLLNLQTTDRNDKRVNGYTIPHAILLKAAHSVLHWPNAFIEMAISIEDSKPLSCTRQKTHPLVASIPLQLKDLKWFVRKELNVLFGKGQRLRFRYPTPATHQVEKPPIFFPKTVKSQAKSLGLPRCEVMNLYQEGSIQCPDKLLGSLLGAPPNAPVLNLDPFTPTTTKKAQGLPIFELVHSCRASKHPWAFVYQAILKGKLKVALQSSKGSSTRFSKCLFTTDIDQVKTICQFQESALSPDTEIHLDDVMFYLRMCRTSRAILRGTGLLPPGKMTLGMIWELQVRYMTFQDVSSYLLVKGMNQFPNFLREDIDKSGLSRMTPDVRIYKREEAEAYLAAFQLGVRYVEREESK